MFEGVIGDHEDGVTEHELGLKRRKICKLVTSYCWAIGQTWKARLWGVWLAD